MSHFNTEDKVLDAQTLIGRCERPKSLGPTEGRPPAAVGELLFLVVRSVRRQVPGGSFQSWFSLTSNFPWGHGSFLFRVLLFLFLVAAVAHFVVYNRETMIKKTNFKVSYAQACSTDLNWDFGCSGDIKVQLLLQIQIRFLGNDPILKYELLFIYSQAT